jgi:uncharacterized protein (UPF0261 family)
VTWQTGALFADHSACATFPHMVTVTVLLIGTLDTKGVEFDFLRTRLKAAGVQTILMDCGIIGPPLAKLRRGDITRAHVAATANADIAALAAAGDRGAAVTVMAGGAATCARTLFTKGRIHGVLSMGGSGNSSIASAAMRALPIGVPKLIVSTLASGDTRPFVGESDIAMMYSVVDIAGINQLSAHILSNAAAAMAGMARSYATRRTRRSSKPLIGATMFGVTTPCVTAARTWLENKGYEVLVFHATGSGGRSLEALVDAGFLSGVLDVTTTEWADELVGGVLSAGPTRLSAAARTGTPQVVSLGALDMVNFGPRDTVPARFADRTIYAHNATVTLMRTTPDECAALGAIIAGKLNAATGPTTLFVPRRGVSMLSVAGQPFHNPAADAALFDACRAHLQPHVTLVERDTDINDTTFAHDMARALHQLITRRTA